MKILKMQLRPDNYLVLWQVSIKLKRSIISATFSHRRTDLRSNGSLNFATLHETSLKVKSPQKNLKALYKIYVVAN